MAYVDNLELEPGYHSRITSIITRIDQTVGELEKEFPLDEIADALTEYLELANEFGYLR